MHFGQFYVRRSCWYRDHLAAPTKIVIPLALMTIAFFVSHPGYNAALLLLALGLVWTSRMPRALMMSFASILYTLLPIITLSWLVFFRQAPYWHLAGPIGISIPAFMRALAMDFRFAAIVLTVPVLLAAMPQQELIAGIRWLGVPFTISHIFAMSLRFIPTLQALVGQVTDAQRSRGIELDRVSPIQKVRNMVALIIPVTFLSITQIETLGKVLEMRGVARRGPKGFYRRPQVGAADWLCMTAAVAVLAAVAVGRYHFGLLVWRV